MIETQNPPVLRSRAPSGCSPFRTAELADRHLTRAEIEYQPGEVNIIRAAAKEAGMTVQEFISAAIADYRRVRRVVREQPAAPPVPRSLGVMPRVLVPQTFLQK